MQGIVEDFIGWVGGLANVGESVTFEPKEDDPFLRAYCFDARQVPGKNAFLIATWNESENEDDSIQLLRMDAVIGNADVANVAIDPRSRPGYPAYFVLMPDTQKLLNLRFEHRRNGSQPFKRYMHGFMAGASSYCVWDPVSQDRLLGYAEDGVNVADDYLPLFEYQLVRRGGDIDWLRAQVSNIRKVIRRAVVQPVIAEHRTFLDGAFGFLGLAPNRRLKADINFEYDLKMHLTLDKLNQILAQCDTPELDDSWSDVGFVMARASGKIHWISGSYAREKEVFHVPRTHGGMIDTVAMAALLADGHLERLIASAAR